MKTCEAKVPHKVLFPHNFWKFISFISVGTHRAYLNILSTHSIEITFMNDLDVSCEIKGWSQQI